MLHNSSILLAELRNARYVNENTDEVQGSACPLMAKAELGWRRLTKRTLELMLAHSGVEALHRTCMPNHPYRCRGKDKQGRQIPYIKAGCGRRRGNCMIKGIKARSMKN